MKKPAEPHDDLLDPAIRQLLEVVEHGSLSAAAKAMGLTQPTLSVAMRKLEEKLSAQLLHRTARGVRPTRAGELLVARAREARAALRAAHDEIGALANEPRGSFRIGCHESLGTYFLPGFMARFLERFPAIQLSLFNANSREVEDAIVERRVDVGLVVNPSNHPDTIVRPLFDDAVAFVAVGKLLGRGPSSEARSVHTLKSTLVLMVPALRQSQELLAQLDHRVRTLECESMALVKSLVLDATGVGILPYRVATHGVPKKRLQVLEGLPRYRDHIALVRRADVPVTRGLRVLIDALQDRGASVDPLPAGLR